MKLIYVKWFDSTYTDTQTRFDKLPPLIEVETAGIYVSEDDKQVVMAQDIVGAQRDGRHFAQIPKVNIIKRRFFKL